MHELNDRYIEGVKTVMADVASALDESTEQMREATALIHRADALFTKCADRLADTDDQRLIAEINAFLERRS